MIEFVILCTLLGGPLSGDLPCLPFQTMPLCLAAEEGLKVSLVTASTCTVVEVFNPSPTNATAPEMSPMPKPRPLKGERSA